MLFKKIWITMWKWVKRRIQSTWRRRGRRSIGMRSRRTWCRPMRRCDIGRRNYRYIRRRMLMLIRIRKELRRRRRLTHLLLLIEMMLNHLLFLYILHINMMLQLNEMMRWIRGRWRRRHRLLLLLWIHMRIMLIGH